MRQILRYFGMYLAATDCAKSSGVSVRSINTIYVRLRRRLAEQCERSHPWAASSKPMSPTLVLAGCVAREPVERQLCVAYSSVVKVSTTRSCLMPPNARCRPFI